MPTPNPRLEPFVGYRVTLAPDAGASSLPRLAPLHPAVRALLDGQRTATLSLREADALYDAAESVSGGLGEPFPVRFTPVRCKRGRALPFETVALGAEEILHLVHDGFFGSARCREAAIAAVQACGVLPCQRLPCRLCRATPHAQPPRVGLTPSSTVSPSFTVDRVRTQEGRRRETPVHPGSAGRGAGHGWPRRTWEEHAARAHQRAAGSRPRLTACAWWPPTWISPSLAASARPSAPRGALPCPLACSPTMWRSSIAASTFR